MKITKVALATKQYIAKLGTDAQAEANFDHCNAMIDWYFKDAPVIPETATLEELDRVARAVMDWVADLKERKGCPFLPRTTREFALFTELFNANLTRIHLQLQALIADAGIVEEVVAEV